MSLATPIPAANPAEMGIDGDFFTLPLTLPDEQVLPARQVSVAFSLAGARRGEFVPDGNVEVRVPATTVEMNTRWGVFRRARLKNVRQVDHKPQITEIDAWERV